MSALIDLACDLIGRTSVTPEDAGCQDLLGSRLAAAGFTLERMDTGEVTNLWARRGQRAPLLCFAGHTDVVPPGPVSQWRSPPFDARIDDGILFGRGAADMKGALAAIIIAIERFVAEQPRHDGSIAVLLTSDEEGPAVDGTRSVMDILTARGDSIDFCIVGEPSAREHTGDRVRVGRRGSINARLEVYGVQGHVAYPEQAINPIHIALPALAEITRHPWDEGQDPFPPTSLQFTDLVAGVGASNVTPASMSASFNLRFSPACDAVGIDLGLREILDRHDLNYELQCNLSGEPFLTRAGELTQAVNAAVQEICGALPEHSTGGGTSDGRFIAPSGAQVIELGPPGKTLHQTNEQVEVIELERLAEIYMALMRRLLG